jgi:predicted nucleic acid-binding protein
MIVVADASVLVGELLRRRGRDLLLDRDLRVLVAEDQWEEAEHELARRLEILQSRGVLAATQRASLEDSVRRVIDTGAIEVAPRDIYSSFKEAALRRVPRDERDWPTVALAIALAAAILTGDQDFLGCGCPTWTVETLLTELDQGGVEA